MKNIYKYLLLGVMLSIVSACNGYLDKPETDDISVDKAFETVKSARKVLNNIYYEVRTAAYNVNTRRIPYALGCDDGIAGSGLWGDKFHTGSWTPDDDSNVADDHQSITPTCSFWKNTYNRVRKANLFLENLYRAQGDEEEKKRMYAEARFLRAFFYSELIRRFGGVIILDHSVEGNDYTVLINQPRESFANSVEWVCHELEEAAKDLPPICSASDIERATSAACYAVIARLRLTAASPLFNTDNPVLASYTTTQYYGNYDKERWKKAADACLYIINLSQYYDLDMTNEADLAPDSWENYYRRFLGRYFLVGKESIWISYELENWGGVKIPWGNRSTGCWNWVNPTYELAMEFEMLDGTMPKDGGNYDLKNTAQGRDRDPRFMATIQYPGAIYDKYDFQPWIGGSASHLQSQKTGMCMQKYIDPLYNDATSGGVRQLRQNIQHIFRYNEILLIYAEAMNEYNDTPTTEVYNAINSIRMRVGMPKLPEGLSKEEMREKIRHERRVELAFEDFRFFDVRRWRIAEDVLNGALHGYDVTKGKDGGFYTIVTVGDPMVFQKKHYLYPLATKELLLNPALEQNPGWSNF